MPPKKRTRPEPSDSSSSSFPSSSASSASSRSVSSDKKSPTAARDASSASKPPAGKRSKTEADASNKMKKSGATRKVTPGVSATLAHKTTGRVVRSPAALDWIAQGLSERQIWAEATPFVHPGTSEAPSRATAHAAPGPGGPAPYDPARMYKFISWNVAGLRGLLRKDANALVDLCARERPDVLMLQETRLNAGSDGGDGGDGASAAATVDPESAAVGSVPGYVHADHPCRVKKGYSGTRTYVREELVAPGGPVRATHARGFAIPPAAEPFADDNEGRLLTTFLHSDGPARPALAVVNTYVPNSGLSLDRLAYRTGSWDPLMRDALRRCDDYCRAAAEMAGGWSGPSKGKQPPRHSSRSRSRSGSRDAAAEALQGGAVPYGFVWAGDLNVADRDVDRYYSGTYKTMCATCGFTPEERLSFRQTLREARGADCFTLVHGPNAAPAYTFWSARIRGREKGLGWRIDYFVVSQRLAPLVVDCFPMPSVTGSDHCPVQMTMWRSLGCKNA